MSAAKRYSIFQFILIALSVLVAMKMIFVGIQLDEIYEITMGYRLARGELMLVDLWDPHQTSAFLMAWQIKVFLTATGGSTTYLVLYLKICGLLIQSLLSCWVYLCLHRYLTNDRLAFYLTIIYFNLHPKGFVTADFSNMLMWSLTGLLLLMIHFIYTEDHAVRLLSCAGIGFFACTLTLSYNTCIIVCVALLIYMIVFIYRRHLSPLYPINALCVALVIFALYMWRILSYMSIDEILTVVDRIINSGVHSVPGSERLMAYVANLLPLMIYLAIYAAIALVLIVPVMILNRRKGLRIHPALYPALMLLTACAVQIGYYLLAHDVYEDCHTYSYQFLLIGIGLFAALHRGMKHRATAAMVVVAALSTLLSVLIVTDLSIFTSVRYLVPCFVLIAAIIAANIDPDSIRDRISKVAIYALLPAWCLCVLFIAGFTLTPTNAYVENITDIGGIIRNGPAKCILTNYFQAYSYNTAYEEYTRYVPDGVTLLIKGSGNLDYLDGNYAVADAMTISDDSDWKYLLDYWEMHPEHMPDVIALNCWYGEYVSFPTDSWILTWIEEEYQPSQVIDGTFQRFFIK